MKRIGRSRRKSRAKYTKNFRLRGKLSLTAFFKRFSDGDRVVVSVEPAYQKGNVHARFIGRHGTIAGKTGGCYQVRVIDGTKPKTLLVHPVHLRRA